MLEKKNALPRSELQIAVDDRDYFARTGQDRANMRRAVVAAFRDMFEVGRILRHEALEKFLEITPRGRVGVFHHNQTATGVPYEYGHDAARHATSADGSGYPISDLVGAYSVGRGNNAGGFNTHARSVRVAVPTRPRQRPLNLTSIFVFRREGAAAKIC